MNLLIVDDEITSIRAVTEMLNASALSIDRCWTALSAAEAKDCMRANPVDLLLCDIEMPQENGLALLEWVNREQLDISCIYMTCYAEFSYAQRAIQLGSSAYLLKPIDPEELERVLRTEMQKRAERSRLRSADQSLRSSRESMTQQFWQSLFYEEIPSSRAAIRQEIEKRLLSIDADWLYCPAMVVVRNWGQELEDDHRLNRYGVHNVVVELFQKEAEAAGCWWTVFPFGQHGQMTVCGGPEAGSLLACARGFAQTYQEAEKQYLKVRSVCYLGQIVPIEQMAEEMEWLMRMDNNRLQNSGIAVHQAEAAPLPAESDMESRFDRWSNLLDGEQFDRAQQEILDYLTQQEGNQRFNKRRFRYFLGRYDGMLTGYAERHQFPLNQLTASPENAQRFEVSSRGLDYMRQWVICSLEQLSSASVSDDPITATKRFIEAHLADPLEMQQIAENVYLNQDYLTRIFKRETGVSVKSYIVSRRMERAKELLETSRIPIADVAYQVGYYNYTSFNRIFKKCYGVSPQSFRKKAK